jgi:hypothetical protein
MLPLGGFSSHYLGYCCGKASEADGAAAATKAAVRRLLGARASFVGISKSCGPSFCAQRRRQSVTTLAADDQLPAAQCRRIYGGLAA